MNLLQHCRYVILSDTFSSFAQEPKVLNIILFMEFIILSKKIYKFGSLICQKQPAVF